MSKYVFVYATLLIFSNLCYSQNSHIVGLNYSKSDFICTQPDIENRLFGGASYYEFINSQNGFNFRFEINYLNRHKDGNISKNNINSFWHLNLLAGKTLFKGKRIQFPLYLGLNAGGTSGDWEIDGVGLTAKVGMRFFIGNRWGLCSDLGYLGFYEEDIEVQYSNGNTELIDVIATNFNFNIGFFFNLTLND